MAYVNIKEVLPTFEHPNVITKIKNILFKKINIIIHTC